MRRFALALIVVMLTLSYVQISLAAPQPAFRDLYWGDPPEKLGVTTVFHGKEFDLPGIELRIKASEDMQLGPLTANMILYGFFKNRLTMVFIVANDPKMLSQIARAKYGEPQNSNMFMIDELYIRGDTSCAVKEDIFDKTGYMMLASTAIVLEYNQWQKEQAEEASKAF